MKLVNKIMLTLMVIFAFEVKLKAQNMYGETLGGVPLKVKIYENITGSPYLSDDWIKGNVVLQNGTKSGLLELKFDQVSNELIFKDQSGTSLKFSNRVKEFVLQPYGENAKSEIYRRDFPAADDNTPDDFLLVLIDGNVKLLKRSKKYIIDSKQYASSNVDRSIEEKKSYYLYKDQKLFKFTNSKSITKEFLSNTKDLEDYISKNKINFKNEKDLIRVVNFVNSLK